MEQTHFCPCPLPLQPSDAFCLPHTGHQASLCRPCPCPGAVPVAHHTSQLEETLRRYGGSELRRVKARCPSPTRQLEEVPVTSRLVRLPPACWGSLPCVSGRDCRPFLSRDSCRDGKGLDERPDCLGPGRVAGWWLGWAPPWMREDTGIRTWVFIISGVSLGSPGPRWASLSLSATCRAGRASTCQFDSLGPAQVSTWALCAHRHFRGVPDVSQCEGLCSRSLHELFFRCLSPPAVKKWLSPDR